MDNYYVYPYSHSEAKRNGESEVLQWRESHKANIACKSAIEKAINQNFDGYHLNHDVAKGVIVEFGHDRVRFVLANTLKQLNSDGRFSDQNKSWAKEFHILPDKINDRDMRRDFVVGSHPAVLDGFVRLARVEYQALNLFEHTHCNPTKDLDFVGKVMVLDPTMLNDKHKSPDFQAILCDGGFGCAPNSRGRKVYGTFLIDDEKCQYQRDDFIGELKSEHYPDWLKEKMEALQSPVQTEDGGMKMT